MERCVRPSAGQRVGECRPNARIGLHEVERPDLDRGPRQVVVTTFVASDKGEIGRLGHVWSVGVSED